MLAAEYGHTDAVTALLAHPGIEVNGQDKYGWTALMHAAQCGHTEAVTALLAHPGIEVNGQDKYGWTALMMAARHGHTDVVTALLAHPGVEANLQSTSDMRLFDSLIKLASDKNFARALQTYLSEHHLPNYLKRRSNEGDYRHWYGKLFGVKKDIKLAAAKALLSGGDLAPHKKALSDGELGRIYRLLQACTGLQVSMREHVVMGMRETLRNV